MIEYLDTKESQAEQAVQALVGCGVIQRLASHQFWTARTVAPADLGIFHVHRMAVDSRGEPYPAGIAVVSAQLGGSDDSDVVLEVAFPHGNMGIQLISYSKRGSWEADFIEAVYHQCHLLEEMQAHARFQRGNAPKVADPGPDSVPFDAPRGVMRDPLPAVDVSDA